VTVILYSDDTVPTCNLDFTSTGDGITTWQPRGTILKETKKMFLKGLALSALALLNSHKILADVYQNSVNNFYKVLQKRNIVIK
jgi:hypothetical protein